MVEKLNITNDAPCKAVLKRDDIRVDLQPGSVVSAEYGWGTEVVTILQDGSFSVEQRHKNGGWDFHKYHKNQVSGVGLHGGGLIAVEPVA